MDKKQRWINLRRELLELTRDQVLSRVGQWPAEVRPYVDAYQREFWGVWQNSSQAQLFLAVQKSRIFLGGDFHAFSQSQRAHLRILRSMKKGGVVLALECFEKKHKELLDKYVLGKMDEKQFLEAVEWDRRWGFPWQHYKPLIAIAISMNYEVVGVNKYYKSRKPMTLVKRDEFMARELVRLSDENPDKTIYCVVGDYHLANSHLPLEIKKNRPGLPVEDVAVLFLNSEKLYFQQVEKAKKFCKVLKKGKNKFCLLNSPPWVKWQSYLMFVENQVDQGIGDEDDEIADYTDFVKSMVVFISKDLGLKTNLNRLAVYTAHDFDVDAGPSSRGFKKSVRYHFKAAHSHYFPETDEGFLARPSINHVATFAAHYIQAVNSQRKRSPFSFPEDFERFIWIQVIAFFLTKIVNHERKPESLTEAKYSYNALYKKTRGRNILNLILRQKRNEIQFMSGESVEGSVIEGTVEEFVEAGYFLGTQMGEDLFVSYRQRQFSMKEIKRLIQLDIDGDSFKKEFESLVEKLYGGVD